MLSAYGLHDRPAPEAVEPLSQWIDRYTTSEAYKFLVKDLGTRELMTPPDELALIYALIQHLRPQWCVEIGTFFAHSAYVMAQAIADRGSATRLITIDPFGHERAPAIIAAWPERLQRVTEFRPVSSMDFFLDLETRGVPKGAASPIGLVFVDGHHNFEYALFDIIRSADHLTPGGAIVVDNLEQDGPSSAVRQFLAWHPGWKLFYDGRSWDATACPAFPRTRQTAWGALLSPPGIEIGRIGHKFLKRGLSYQAVHALSFNLVESSHFGTLDVNFLYVSLPHDSHKSGLGGIQERRVLQTCSVPDNSSSIRVEFESPATFEIPSSGTNLYYELELRYQADASADAYLLLDPNEPVTLIASPCR